MGERKISNGNAAIMIAFAILFDLANIVVEFVTMGIGGFFMDAVTTIVFSIWFSHFGVSLISSRNVLRTITAIVFDAFPGTDLLFPWTLQVAYTALTERNHEAHMGGVAQKMLRRGGWRI